MAKALLARALFDGTSVRSGHAVVIDDGRIVAVVPDRDVPAGVPCEALDGLLAPGFIDVQVNGGGGVLFNERRDVDAIHAIGVSHRQFGTTGFMVTFITDTRERMREAMAAADAALVAGVPGLLGIHVEGPFINRERKGVHDPELIRPITDEDVAILCGAVAGRVLVTLAPETMDPDIIAALTKAGVLICAGHTTAGPDILAIARTKGLTGYTHLFNAMPPLAGREPGPVGSAMAERETFCGLIVDGYHVGIEAMRVAVAAKGTERIMLVSDAMPCVGTTAPTFDLQGRTVFRRNGRCTIADGTLAGSDLDMATAVRNTVAWLDLPLEAALRMASAVPATFLGLDDELGRIAPDFRADLVLLDPELRVLQTWIDGASCAAGLA